MAGRKIITNPPRQKEPTKLVELDKLEDLILLLHKKNRKWLPSRNFMGSSVKLSPKP